MIPRIVKYLLIDAIYAKAPGYVRSMLRNVRLGGEGGIA